MRQCLLLAKDSNTQKMVRHLTVVVTGCTHCKSAATFLLQRHLSIFGNRHHSEIICFCGRPPVVLFCPLSVATTDSHRFFLDFSKHVLAAETRWLPCSAHFVLCPPEFVSASVIHQAFRSTFSSLEQAKQEHIFHCSKWHWAVANLKQGRILSKWRLKKRKLVYWQKWISSFSYLGDKYEVHECSSLSAVQFYSN